MLDSPQKCCGSLSHADIAKLALHARKLLQDSTNSDSDENDDGRDLRNLVAALGLILIGFSIVGVSCTCWLLLWHRKASINSTERFSLEQFERDAWKWNPNGLSLVPMLSLHERNSAQG